MAFMSVKEVADKFSITKNIVRGAINSGELQAYKPGGNRAGYRISDEDAESWWQTKIANIGKEGK